jgi:AcrR family transcriptional regulator
MSEYALKKVQAGAESVARPRSEDKRRAILDAAVELFAERGIAHVPTSAISAAAGVAEGTLFTYFKSKDELMNELYREIRREIDRQLEGYPADADPRTRVRFVWDKLVDLCVAQPKRLKVQTQLRTSGRLLKNSEIPGRTVREMLATTREVVAGDEYKQAPADFIVLLIRAHAEATVEYILAHPEQESVSRDMGFKLIWRGLTGQ